MIQLKAPLAVAGFEEGRQALAKKQRQPLRLGKARTDSPPKPPPVM